MKNCSVNSIEEKSISLFEELFPINRSIMGDGVRESLNILKKYVPFTTLEYPTRMKCFDWEIPKEWNIRDAYVKDSKGNKIIDFKKHNLHIVSYSVPINRKVSRDELFNHLYTRVDLPDAIPYRTSYYKERWGFCLEHNKLNQFTEDEYEVLIDSTLSEGSLTIGEFVIKGENEQEILFTSYMCHPSMANNELSGPIMITLLAEYLSRQKNLKFTYRFVIAPETIGSIVYLSQKYKTLKDKVIAGYVVSQVGIKDDLIYKESREKKDLNNRVVNHIHRADVYKLKKQGFTPNGGGDQRQYCSLGINMPIGYIGRSLGGSYKEYHSSLDNVDIISFEKMQETFNFLKEIVSILEINDVYINQMPYCEPNLGKRGLYPTIGGEKASEEINMIKYLLGYCDGKTDVLDIAELTNKNILEYRDVLEKLQNSNLLKSIGT